MRAYVDALDARDFATSNAMTAAGLDSQYHWWSRPGSMTDLRIVSAHVIQDMSAYRHTSLFGHRYGAEVETSVIFNGGDLPQGRQPWSFYLARQNKSQPWTIIDMGQG